MNEQQSGTAAGKSDVDAACSTAGDDIIATVFKYIDRMNDIVDSDPADLILSEFTAEIEPMLSRYVADGSR